MIEILVGMILGVLTLPLALFLAHLLDIVEITVSRKEKSE